MKIFTLTCVAWFITLCATAQSVSLREFCPYQLGQEDATCASYAPVYTALSTQYNAAHDYHHRDSAFTTFSYGFVASKMKSDKRGFSRIFNRCGKNVTADMTLEVLKEVGTVRAEQFPYVCACGKQKALQQTAQTLRIADFLEIGNGSSLNADHLKAIKEALDNRCPVVIAILQTGFFRSNKSSDLVFPTGYLREDKNSNHVVCIVGYDDNRKGGSFLVKNNYTTWGGDNGFGYVPYDDLFKLIHYSYRIKL